MLRKRSRAVASKQAIVSDQTNFPWLPPERPTKPISFFFSPPTIFKGFRSLYSPTSSSESEPIMSPTSILDTQPFSSLKTKIQPTITPKTSSENTHSWEQPNNMKGIGLALDDDNPEIINSHSIKQQKRKLVVFGSQLKIQVPPLPPSSVFPCFSPESPKEFGIKTPKTHLWPFGNRNSQVHPVEIAQGDCEMENNDGISVENIEESEDYTCVISHGPNPKTTHIFGNCIVESCCGIDRSSSFSSRRNGYLSPLGNSVVSQENFLSCCHHCKKQLDQGRDIYMYRGEKAFCSEECRCQEMYEEEES